MYLLWQIIAWLWSQCAPVWSMKWCIPVIHIVFKEGWYLFLILPHLVGVFNQPATWINKPWFSRSTPLIILLVGSVDPVRKSQCYVNENTHDFCDIPNTLIDSRICWTLVWYANSMKIYVIEYIHRWFILRIFAYSIPLPKPKLQILISKYWAFSSVLN